MTEIEYIVTSDKLTLNDTIIINVGDSFKISYGTYRSGGVDHFMGLYAQPKYDAPELVEGDYPPEIQKNDNFLRNKGRYVYYMRRYIQLNTVGTYTFVKGYATDYTDKGSKYGTLTLIVKKPTPTIPVNVSGSWKESEGSVNVSGTWKTIDNAYVNVNGVWKEI